MKKSESRRTISSLALVIFMLALNSCKKDSKKPIPPPPPSPCKLTDIESTIFARYQHYWFVYDKTGNLDSAYYSEVPGPKNSYEARCKEDPDGYVWYSTANTTAETPTYTDFLYSGSITDSSRFPASLATSFTDFTNLEQPGYGYNFQYKANGRLDGYEQTAPFVTGLLTGLGVEYTSDGDIQSMQFAVITGPKTQSTVTTSGFDGHPTPYAAIAGWVFRNPGTGWGGAEFDALLFGLSEHNPLQWVYKDNNGVETLREVMTYEYNDQGQPTKRTVVRTNPQGGSQTYTETFTYDCN